MLKMKSFLGIFVIFKVVTSSGLTDNNVIDKNTLATQSLNRIEGSFKKYTMQYGKEYLDKEEYSRKLAIYTKNVQDVEKHNLENHTWTKSVNKFSDLSGKEFEEVYGKGYLNTHRPTAVSSKFKGDSHPRPPKSRDWRKHGMITEVKDQGSCGSCWAHAATEQLESYLRLDTRNNLVNISVQQITSCTPNALQCGGSGGCAGGLPQFGFDYARLVGVVRDEEYPYISGKTTQTEPCRYNASTENAIAYTRGEETLPHNDYRAIINHIAHKGPLAIAVAVTKAWAQYSGGVFDGCSYDDNIPLNHAVQLVGYGEDEKDVGYWIVRNSWGLSWGEHGYIRLARESSLKCGVNHTPLSGTGCKGDGIKIQRACGMCGVLFEATYPIGTETNNHEEPTIEIVL